MSIETLTPQDPSRESLAQLWTWPKSLFPRQDIPTSQEITLKTVQDDETVAERALQPPTVVITECQ
ncbi:hypothetical protein FOMG_19725 [Fusarium oxysporum f. sp. melonis 26406]|uniref:Uncharacterized protein n=1 Tax=Fusarium oxysporum f. sp. melonis 26406 TaxID=1089452 RepID=W9Z5I3_FUSOX|nr:hypothetical protein FOMG_19725 [Fusarium oxysporum f. sp. melonis 26406]